ncbi:chemotaxis protein MotB [Desulfohalotomaculum tongense]|uniref:OmpA/MotB family protein n=1 Tax=Desulforadius tongensis TaxID=1216062 RepID=UPI0019561764|nr:flagellar motor protein MotB [Desulforadius tongensis]MBM7856061.1 chemotaxis protein MotB [Desulforadius tongensis]
MSKRDRLLKGKEKENHERWLITYADMITLLMIFFIVMYTMSKIDASRFQAIAESLHKAMGGRGAIMYDGAPGLTPATYEKTDPGDVQTLEMQETQSLLKIKEQIEDYLEKNGLQDKVTVELEDRGVVVSFMDVVLFPLGSAELNADSVEIIQKVGGILSQVSNYIRVEGHTDNLPINTVRFPSNWELSTARATRVVKELINTHRLPPERLSATGYGEYRPRRPNDTAENRRHNRRVDIVVLRNRFDEVEPGKKLSVQQVIKSQTTTLEE